MKNSMKRYGPWALVTGASQGIGEGFAQRLAAEGYNLVLASRSTGKLERLGAELSKAHGIQTRAVAADLSVPGAAAKLIEELGSLNVGLLISNAGAAHMGGFLQNDVQALQGDVVLNALSHMELAHGFGSRLRRQGRTGGMLLVSSTAALQPVALGANYAASKAFVHNLGEGLHRELRDQGIDVSVLLPGPTNTQGLHDRSDVAMGKLPMAAMSVSALVNEGLNALRKRQASHIAGAMNRWSARLLPRRFLAWMLGTVLRKNTAPHLLPSAPIAGEPASEKAPQALAAAVL